jgi:phosphoserine phosphatase
MASAAAAAEGKRVSVAQEALRNAKAVCFDVDSTVLTGEGIDALAKFAGVEEEVVALTTR